MQSNITRKFAEYVANVNMATKICYNSRDIELFPRDYFFGTPCIHTRISFYSSASCNITVGHFIFR